MKKLISVLATLILAMWWLGSQPVQAADVVAIDADTVGYDPAQGGLVFNPPSEIWGKVGTIMNIPFMYASPGDVKLSERRETQYMVDQGNGFETMPTSVNWNTMNFSSATPYNYYFSARYNVIGNYSVVVRQIQGVHVFDKKITFHILSDYPSKLMSVVDGQHFISIYPINIYFYDVNFDQFIPTLSLDLGSKINDSSWAIGVGARPNALPLVPGHLSLMSLVENMFVPLLPAGVFAQKTITVTFGISAFTGHQGVNLPLGAEYPHPRPDTELTFDWYFNDEKISSSSEPELSASALPRSDGKIYVDLVYTDTATNYTYTIRTNTVPYTYVPAPEPTPYLDHLNVSIAELIKGDVRRPAAWPSLQVGPGSWRLNVAMTRMARADGKTLDATLILPTGEQVTPEAPAQITFTNEQAPMLQQAEWLFHQQVDALVGTYHSTVQFTLITGP